QPPAARGPHPARLPQRLPPLVPLPGNSVRVCRGIRLRRQGALTKEGRATFRGRATPAAESKTRKSGSYFRAAVLGQRPHVALQRLAQRAEGLGGGGA